MTTKHEPDRVVPVDELRKGDLIRRSDGALMEVIGGPQVYERTVWVEVKVNLSYRLGEVVAVTAPSRSEGEAA